MPIIVLNAGDRERYVLVGVADNAQAAVCDAEGRVRWVSTETLKVIDVDGTPPIELLAERRKGSGSRAIVEDILEETDSEDA